MSGTSASVFSSSFPMATVATHISLDDIANASADRDPNYETPILRLLSASKAKGYDTVCIPLTNEKWRERWKKMCLSPEDEAEKDDSAERVSEAWRSNPVFLREEVNVTRLGAWAESSKCTLGIHFYHRNVQMRPRIQLSCCQTGSNSILKTSGSGVMRRRCRTFLNYLPVGIP